MEKFKWLFAVVGGVVSTVAHQYGLIIIFVVVAICMDVITGLTKALVTEGFISEKVFVGGAKKVALFLGLVFGFYLDYFIPFMLGGLGIALPISGAIFSMLFGCYIVINELISIAENLYDINPEILPKWVKNMLNSAKKQIDSKGDDNSGE